MAVRSAPHGTVRNQRVFSRASPNMARTCNLSPLHRPPALDSGRVQKRIRRAYVATGKLVGCQTREANVRVDPLAWSLARGAARAWCADRKTAADGMRAIFDESGGAVGWGATGSAFWPEQLDLAIAGSRGGALPLIRV